MKVRAIRTDATDKIVNQVKSSTKREIFDIDSSIPDTFVQKKKYMQSEEFLNDPHNKKMFEYIDKLMICRDNIIF